jgi:sugar/nucleoside kinase (ribokinase family)
MQLHERLQADAERITQTTVVSGFDGFVDEMIRVVDERHGLEQYQPVDSIARFGELVSAAAGRSSLREIVVEAQHPGGCAINLADGMASLGVDCRVFATVGDPVHPAFAAVAAKVRLQPLGTAFGRTLAFEFHDGKYMLSAVEQLGAVTPALLQQHAEELRQALNQSAAMALVNWTLYPHMTDCWRWLADELLPRLHQRPLLFLDLVDPRSRSQADQHAMLDAMRALAAVTDVVFGGNLNEANAVAELLGIAESAEDPTAMTEQADEIRQALGLSRVVVHSIRHAVQADDQGRHAVAGPYCAAPKKSTGAGDRFNAGWLLASCLDWPADAALQLGCASSGFFVRQARSASVADLVGFCREWEAGVVG